jgi:amino acid transporter
MRRRFALRARVCGSHCLRFNVALGVVSLRRDTLFSHAAIFVFQRVFPWTLQSHTRPCLTFIFRIDTSSGDLKLPHCATSTVFTSSSVVNIFFQTAGRSGGLFLACTLLVCVTFAGHSAFTVCSRCMYAISRVAFGPLSGLPISLCLIFNRSLSTKHCSFVVARLSFSLPLVVSITACVVSASLSYAIGRDGALPRQLARINSMSQLPTNAIGAVFVATSLLSLVHPSTLDHVTFMFPHDA